MGIYRIEAGCALDIFTCRDCLTLAIDSAKQQIALSVCSLDAPLGSTVCLLQVPNTPPGWRQLRHLAQEEIVR